MRWMHGPIRVFENCGMIVDTYSGYGKLILSSIVCIWGLACLPEPSILRSL